MYMAYYYSPFRKKYGKPSIGCPFCNQKRMEDQAIVTSAGAVVENKHYRWVINHFPKFEGHTLVIPKRHILAFGEETAEEIYAREELVTLATKTLELVYPGAGVEIFIQYGKGSEASIPHLHWHVVPSLPEDPLRGFDKLGQFFSIEQNKEKVILFPVKIRKARGTLRRALAKHLGTTSTKRRTRNGKRPQGRSHGRR